MITSFGAFSTIWKSFRMNPDGASGSLSSLWEGCAPRFRVSIPSAAMVSGRSRGGGWFAAK
jgi:hypothetical protein